MLLLTFVATVASYLEPAGEGSAPLPAFKDVFFCFFLLPLNKQLKPFQCCCPSLKYLGSLGTVCSRLICDEGRTHRPDHGSETASFSLSPSVSPSLHLFLSYLSSIYRIPAFDQCQGHVPLEPLCLDVCLRVCD